MKAEKTKLDLTHQRDEALNALKQQSERAKRDFESAVHPSDDFNAHIASTLVAAAFGGMLIYMAMHKGKNGKSAKPKTKMAKIKNILADTAQDLGAMVDWEKVATQAVGLFAKQSARKHNGRVH